MLGLRPENDQNYYKKFQKNTSSSGGGMSGGPTFKKTMKFANSLNDRFYVSGISGSFSKHQKHMIDLKDAEERKNPHLPEEETGLQRKNSNQEEVENYEMAQEGDQQESTAPTHPRIHFPNPRRKEVKKYSFQPVLEKKQREELRKEAQRLAELEEKLAEIQRIKEAKRKRDRARRKRKLEYLSAKCIQRHYCQYSSEKKRNSVDILINFLRSIEANAKIAKLAWAISVLTKFFRNVSSFFCSL
jgi:hypothetical protein